MGTPAIEPLAMRNSVFEALDSEAPSSRTLAPLNIPSRAQVVLVGKAIDEHALLLSERLSDRGFSVTRIGVDSDRLGFALSSMGLQLDGVPLGPSPLFMCRSIPTPRLRSATHYHRADFILAEHAAAVHSLFSRPGLRWATQPSQLVAADCKITQLAAATDLGFRVPRWCLTQDPDTLRTCLAQFPGTHVAVKPLSSSVHENHRYRLNLEVQKYHIGNLVEAHGQAIREAPTFVQEWISKAREIRCTVVGREVFAVAMRPTVPGEHADWSRLPPSELTYEVVELDPQRHDRLTAFAAYFDLNYCAIDLVEDTSGQLYFLENNPVGAWYWLEQETGLPITEAIVENLVTLTTSC